MKKFALLALLAAALAAPSIAAAATPQGKLTGSATAVSGTVFAIGSTVIDGGTDPLYIGKENDKSGNCDGDSGTIVVNGVDTTNVVCAHFVASSRCCNAGSPKMRFAVQSGTGDYRIFRITDNGASLDTIAAGITTSLATARAWVNTGAVGSGNAGGWTFVPLMSGNYTVIP